MARLLQYRDYRLLPVYVSFSRNVLFYKYLLYKYLNMLKNWSLIMKFLKLFAAGIVLLAASSANASTVLTATDGDVNFLFSPITGFDLYMFDDTAFGSTTNLMIDIPSVVGIAGPQTDLSGTYHIASNLNGALRLDGSVPSFVLGISNDGVNFIADTSAVFHGNGNAATLTFDVNGSVLVVDVVPAVPVPAAVWLFGSGLIGLVGVARRRA
jgi:hypothetical protein